MANPQLEYSNFVAENLKANNQFAIAEAHIGTDRIQGYLTPAMKHVEETGERVLITVASRKDLNSIQPAVSYTVLKERFSYVCLRKFYACINNASAYLTTEERINFLALITWQERTKDGDLNEVLHHSRSPILWKKVACEAPSCNGAGCEHYSKCWYQKAKKSAENSNLLLVTHNLFLQDMQMDFVILPHYEKIILDNAHKLPLESQKVFGRHLHFYALRNAVKQNIWCKNWEEAAAKSEKAFLALIKEIQSYATAAKKRKFVYNQNLSSETGISPESLQNSLKELLDIIDQTGSTKDHMQFASDIRKISSDIAFFFAASNNDFVYWIDCNSNPHQVAFNAEPVNVSSKFSKTLYPNIKSAIFISDTASINGQFEYLINRLALFGKKPKTKIFEGKKAEELPEVFAADFLPKPTEEKFADELAKTLCEIISKNKTNTLIFADMASISKLQAEIKKDENLKSKTCFFQGTDGNFFNLASFFQKEIGSVLVGTPDELKTLEEMELPENSLVVIARLPFPDLKEPVLAKRMEILKEQNKNGFMYITMPETSLVLRRIYSAISCSSKKQTLLLLDSRIVSEQYGAKIQSLFPNLKTLSHRVFSTGFFS